LAHAAALAVAEHPGESYNPLFLYGGTGLGKTHLLHAIGQHPVTRGKRVIYVSSETFTNDLVNAIRNQMTNEFRRMYRETDLLLIDDVQFIGGKESTQEEFFHTFNHLYSSNKQIIISSDRHPRAIPTLEDRVRSRFEGGMITDIQPPDFEMRIAILRTKAEAISAIVPDEVIDFIARKVQSNIRELEGALTRVLGYARLMNSPLTVDLANTVLQDILRHQPITPEQIILAVAEFYRVDVADLTGRSRNKEVVLPRQMAMYLLREETGTSLPQIGEMLGGRDHTTVIYSHDKMAEEVETIDARRREVLSIKEKLYREPKS
jgi:chromosomal replication initiator protein